MSALEGYSGGYPYLRIARYYNIPYGDVLNYDPIRMDAEYQAAHVLSMKRFRGFRRDVIDARAHFKLVQAGMIKSDTPVGGVTLA